MADGAQRSPESADDMRAARRVLLEDIAREIAWSGIGDGGRELNPKVRDAMLRVPRERFVPPDLWPHAHDRMRTITGPCRSAMARPSRSR
ncbi:MAG: hypothetical protein K0S35_3661 [Geminicoccaceae bacterium]|nr:hypothetical protein [Geminicoccaceae bacterium]